MKLDDLIKDAEERCSAQLESPQSKKTSSDNDDPVIEIGERKPTQPKKKEPNIGR